MTKKHKQFIDKFVKKMSRLFKLASKKVSSNKNVYVATAVIGLVSYLAGMAYADKSTLFIIVGVLGTPLMSLSVIKIIVSE